MNTQSLEWYDGAIRAAQLKGMSLRTAALIQAKQAFISLQKARRH